jgi:hypothetical protein
MTRNPSAIIELVALAIFAAMILTWAAILN